MEINKSSLPNNYKTMEPWISESNRKSNLIMAALVLVAGLALAIKAWGVDLGQSSNERAALMLGLLLIVIGVVALLSGGKETVTVDPQRGLIEIEKTNLIGKTKKEILFTDIEDVLIGWLGKKSNYVNFYYIILKVKDKGEVTLFSPGYFKGASDRSVVEAWKTRLQEYLKLNT